MKKSLSKFVLAAALATVGTSNVFAQATTADPKTKPATTGEVAKQGDKHAAKSTVKPKDSPGWVVVEEDWWLPLRYDFSTALHNARVQYRAGQEEAAASEIEKARTWLKYAQSHADKTTQEALSMASADLEDFAVQLQAGKGVKARQLESAFAHASAALAQHHHFLASKALAADDMKTASRHLKAAVEHLREAASSANYEYGSQITEVYERHWPLGTWDETVIFEKSQLATSLAAVESELAKISAKLK